MGAKALIALGSNATSRHGEPVETVRAALDQLTRNGLRLAARSRLYRTPFVPAGAGEDVVNAVAVVETELAPEAVLAVLHDIEAVFGRSRAARWGSRTLDLDLLLMGDRILPDRAVVETWQAMPVSEQRVTAPDALLLPHPRLAERAFVLVPAAEVAPDWLHPIFDRTIAELLSALPEEDVRALHVLAG